MSITKSAIRRLEKMVYIKPGYLITPVLSSPAVTDAMRQEAKKQGKIIISLPLEIAKKYGIKLWNYEDLLNTKKRL